MQTIEFSESSEPDSPIDVLVYYTICSAIEKHATEIRIEQGDTTSRIAYFANGEYLEELNPPLETHNHIAARLANMLFPNTTAEDPTPHGAIAVALPEHLGARTIELAVCIDRTKPEHKVIIRIPGH